MRAAVRHTDYRKAWKTPSLSSFKLTDQELARVQSAASPGDELEQIYRNRFA